MVRRFAENTTVSVEKSKAEIEGLVMRYGASAFHSGWQEGMAAIGFVMRDRRIRFVLPLPKRDDPQFARTPKQHQLRSPQARLEAWEQSCRQRWRALALAIKAKLEAVEAGISEFEQEFLAFIIDPATGRTIGDELVPQVKVAYDSPDASKPIGLLPAPVDSKDGDQ